MTGTVGCFRFMCPLFSPYSGYVSVTYLEFFQEGGFKIFNRHSVHTYYFRIIIHTRCIVYKIWSPGRGYGPPIDTPQVRVLRLPRLTELFRTAQHNISMDLLCEQKKCFTRS